jgi:NTP pyrophosphatase (non-canonical NTP hydrolase)
MDSSNTRRSSRSPIGTRARRLCCLVALVAIGGCVSHPVGPARTFGKYESKARTSARAALSATETARLAAQAGSNDRAFGPYLSVLISEAEEAASAVEGTFASIQPPDERADRMRQELGDLLSSVVDHLADLRIAVRRGELRRLEAEAEPLRADADDLRRFIEEHE